MIDWTQPISTRDGQKVRIYSRDCGGTEYNVIHGAIFNTRINEWAMYSWYKDGSYRLNSKTTLDLVNVPKAFERTVWINVYPDYISDAAHRNKANADAASGSTRIACVEVKVHGLERDGL